MRNLSRILTVILCCAPVMSIAAGPVATTNGSNLTSYNPSNAYNNQWANISNGRYDSNDNTSAKVDFGNCNAVVLRCAQPKCSGGGCTDSAVAEQIVSGCVKTNDKCKQYGDDLINYMTAQLVATSNAKVNEQKMALETAKIQAEAQAKASSAASEEQLKKMEQMQAQMAQMQQQMSQQQEESNRQLQEALAQQNAQSAAALESMKTAATDAAKENESGLTAYQQEAVERGISEDVIARKTITGEVMTSIEDAELKLKDVYVAMKNSFDYAKCDSRGNSCGVPTRIKKWRELARGFSEPYTDSLKKIYDALITAQTVGVDLSQIYMMLNNSCNQWGEYLCPAGGEVDYPTADNTKEGPRVCKAKDYDECVRKCKDTYYAYNLPNHTEHELHKTGYAGCQGNCQKRDCSPCRLVRLISDGEEVMKSWVETDVTTSENRSIISCASGALQSSTLFAPLLKHRDDKALVNMENLEKWLDQVESNSATGEEERKEGKMCKAASRDGTCYCGVSGGEKRILEQAVAKKSVTSSSNYKDSLCWENLWSESNEAESGDSADVTECAYINPVFAICDTHPYNANRKATVYTKNQQLEASEKEEMDEIIGLKITVISQQMYKQYEYLRATLERLQVQLKKSVLSASLEAAGSKSSSSSGGLSFRDEDKEIYLPGAENCGNLSSPKAALECIQRNLSLVLSAVTSNKSKACKQLQNAIKDAQLRGVDALANKTEYGKEKEPKYKECSNIGDGSKNSSCDKNDIKQCAKSLNALIGNELDSRERSDKRSSYPWGNIS